MLRRYIYPVSLYILHIHCVYWILYCLATVSQFVYVFIYCGYILNKVILCKIEYMLLTMHMYRPTNHLICFSFHAMYETYIKKNILFVVVYIYAIVFHQNYEQRLTSICLPLRIYTEEEIWKHYIKILWYLSTFILYDKTLNLSAHLARR